VRELRNVLQKAAALTANGIIHARHIQFEGANGVKAQKAPQAKGRAEVAVGSLSIEEMEIRHIQDLLKRHKGHRRTVADILGISERTLYRKLNRYGLHSGQ
jgi:DNA-binding NtrC family response regulator